MMIMMMVMMMTTTTMTTTIMMINIHSCYDYLLPDKLLTGKGKAKSLEQFACISSTHF